MRLKGNVKLLTEILSESLDGYHFQFFVISAGQREVVRSALDGIVPPENVFESEFEYKANTGEICTIKHVPAGNDKVAVLEAIELKLQLSSDLYVMHDVNSLDGHTIAVSETKSFGRITHKTGLSDSEVSKLVPI